MRVKLLFCSGTDACEAGVRVDCIAAGAHHCHVSLNPHEAPSNARELYRGYNEERFRWPGPKACSGSCALWTPVASLVEDHGLTPPQWIVRPRRVCSLQQLVQTSCVHSLTALVDQFTQLRLGFP